MTAAFAVTAWNDTQPIDLRTAPPSHLRTSVESLLEAFAATAPSPDATRYLPEEYLTILLG